jgi:flagellar motor protein MotB
MKPATMPRWAVSFADLTLLLLAFFVLLHAGSAREVAASARAAFSSEPLPGPLLDARADALFEPGEARLRPSARQRLLEIARQSTRPLLVESEGRDPAAHRFDGWELAAARAAAVARALSDGGMTEDNVSIVLPRDRQDKRPEGQRLLVRRGA